ncbi:protein of unknown function [Pararobbsia alpina]
MHRAAWCRDDAWRSSCAGIKLLQHGYNKTSTHTSHTSNRKTSRRIGVAHRATSRTQIRLVTSPEYRQGIKKFEGMGCSPARSPAAPAAPLKKDNSTDAMIFCDICRLALFNEFK